MIEKSSSIIDKDVKRSGNDMNIVISPKNTFFTKFSPVYYVNYSDQLMGMAGGPLSFASL